MSDPIIIAPWTEDQVAAINAWQASGVVHPFTCEADHARQQTLVAERDGWHCPDPDCSYTQDWAMTSMTDLDLLRRTQRTRTVIWGSSAYVRDPLAEELKRVREELRRTQDDLADARGQIATLTQQNHGMRIVLARVNQVQKAGGSPSVYETAGDCDAVWVLGDTGGRSIEDNPLPVDDVPEERVDNCE